MALPTRGFGLNNVFRIVTRGFFQKQPAKSTSRTGVKLIRSPISLAAFPYTFPFSFDGLSDLPRYGDGRVKLLKAGSTTIRVLSPETTMIHLLAPSATAVKVKRQPNTSIIFKN